MITVTATYVRADGTPEGGTVSFRPWVEAVNSDTIVTAREVVATLDGTGAIRVELIASNDPGWQTTGPMPWLITEVIGGHRHTWSAELLAPGPVDLAHVRPTSKAPDIGTTPVPGPPGPPNTLIKGTVITGPPGTPADFSLTGDAPEQTLSMTLPQGMPGEVTAAQLAAVTPTLHEGPMPSIELGTQTPEQIRDGWAAIADGWHYWPADRSRLGEPATLVLVDRAPESAVTWVRISVWSGLQHREIWTGPEGGAALTMRTGDVTFHGADPGATFVRRSGLTHTGVILAADAAPGKVLTSDATGVGAWADLPAADILAPVWERIGDPALIAPHTDLCSWITGLEDDFDSQQAEIGDPALVAPHTNLVFWLGALSDRVGRIEGSGDPVPPSLALVVDNYAEGFTRVQTGAVPTTQTTASIALATVAGPGGAVFPALGDVPGQGAVWSDNNGSMGKVKTAAGADVLGSTIKEWIRRGDILAVHRAGNDLIVDGVAAPTPAGSSLRLRDLHDVTAPPGTPAGMLLGTTAQGAWGAVADTGASTAATVGNLLTAGVASAESMAGWAAGRATLVVTPGGGLSGACLTATATPNQKSSYFGNRTSDNAALFPVSPGVTYTWQAMLRADTSTAAAQVAIYWRGADGTTPAGTPGYAISAAVPLSKTWTLHTVTGVAPPGAALACFGVHPLAATGESYQLDQIGLWRGAGGDWASPGVPIVNQGVRSSRPNGTDKLVEVWDGAAWTMSAYRSGVRTVPGGIAIRDGNTVTWTGSEAAPAGFRDTYATGGKVYLTGDPIPSSLPGTPAP